MRFLAKLLKHWYLYLIPVLLLPAAGTLYGKQKLSVYETSALLFVNSSDPLTGTNTDFNSFVSPAQNGANMMNQLLQGTSFVIGVGQATDLAKQFDLTNRTDKDIVANRIRGDVLIYPTGVGANLVTVTVDDKSPTIALQVAQAFLSSSPDYLETQRLAQDHSNEAFVNQQLDTVKAAVALDVQKLNEYINAHPNSGTFGKAPDPQHLVLLDQLNTDSTTQARLLSQLSSIKSDELAATSNRSKFFTVWDTPLPPLRPTLHLKGLIPYFGGGLAAALALILLIVGTRTVLDRKVYSTRDLRNITEEMELDIPLLTEIPVLETLTRSNRRQHDDDVLSGVLVPILTVLPQSSTEVLNHEIRSAVGVSVMDDD
jgi:hypothetical protein